MCPINLHDKPINDIDDDYFDIEKRVVEKIYDLIQDSAFFLVLCPGLTPFTHKSLSKKGGS